MFAVGQRAAALPSTSTATAVLIVHVNIRCAGVRRGGRCNTLVVLMAAEPIVWDCPRCGHHNDSRNGSWAP